MTKNIAIGSRLPGLDISHYQAQVDWQKLKKSGCEFVFLKATEGGDYVDRTFATRREECKAVGIPVGAYHFFRPKTAVMLQIANFVGTVGRIQPGEMRPVLDVEVPSLWNGLSEEELSVERAELRAQWNSIKIEDRVKMVVQWCEAVEAGCGLPPIIYMSSSFAGEVLGNAPELARWTLWVAHYTTAADPWVPAPWSNWTFWQYTDKGSIEGVPGHVDLNWFNGTSEELQAYYLPFTVEPKGAPCPDDTKPQPSPPPAKEKCSLLLPLVNAGILAFLATACLIFPSPSWVYALCGAILISGLYCVGTSSRG